jgi:hypothetical protein
MKRHRKRRDRRHDRHAERLIARKIRQEQNGGFKCSHCKRWVVVNEYMGTANRNHCNLCLWSKHVDIKKGDRRATCQAGMRPIGLTFRIEDATHRGEIMLIHLCSLCPKISINRIAADDGEQDILEIFAQSHAMPETLKMKITQEDIYLATETDREDILDQLFGCGRR